jgi:hypothetical protein
MDSFVKCALDPAKMRDENSNFNFFKSNYLKLQNNEKVGIDHEPLLEP